MQFLPSDEIELMLYLLFLAYTFNFNWSYVAQILFQNFRCHVWPLLSLFLPEARSAIDFMCQWISEASIKDKERSLHRDHRLRIENE